MLSVWNRLTKSIIAGTLWLLLRLPTDVVLIQCRRSAILPYAVTIQLLDFLVVTYLVYQLMTYRLRKPWQCPACDGWGRRQWVPGMGSAQTAQLTKCPACNGQGIIWELQMWGQHRGN